MIIDAHVHVTDDGTWFSSGLDASMAALLHSMDQAGVDKAVVLPLAGYTSNATVARCVKLHPDRLIGFGTLGLHPSRREVLAVQDFDLAGVKFHPRLERRDIASLETEGILEELGNAHLPLVICGWLQSHTVPLQKLTPFALDAVAKRHPSVVFILAHMGGHHLWDACFVARSNANVYLDCSYALKIYAGTSLEGDFAELIERVDQKLIFGSDFPEIDIKEYLDRVSSIIDARREGVNREAVLGGNLLRAIGRVEP